MRWSVYKIKRRGPTREAVGLGYVNAPDQPSALAAAWSKWPHEVDGSQTQAGFTVRVYRDDHMNLGKIGKTRNI